MDIVNGLLSEGEVCFVVGAAAIRDSAAVSLGVSVARGGEWLGWSIPQYRQVVCIQRSWTEEEFEGLVGATVLDPRTKTPEPGHAAVLARFVAFTPKQPLLGVNRGHNELLRVVQKWKPALIVLASLDSLSFMPPQANYFEAIHAVSRTHGAAILLTTSGSPVLGSSVVDTPPDAIWDVQDDGKPAGPEGWTGTIRVRRKVSPDVLRRYTLTPGFRFVAT